MQGERDLEVQVDDLLSVDVADPLQYLLGEDTASLLRENKLIFNHPVKKLPASNAAREIESKFWEKKSKWQRRS